MIVALVLVYLLYGECKRFLLFGDVVMNREMIHKKEQRVFFVRIPGIHLTDNQPAKSIYTISSLTEIGYECSECPVRDPSYNK